MMFKGLDIETITKEDVEFTMSQIRFFGLKLGSYSALIRDLMLAGFCMLIMIGCGEGRNISKPSPEIQARAKVYSTSFSREVAAIEKIDAVTTKQDALSSQVDSFASKSLELNQLIVDKLTELNGSILETRRTLGTMEASLSTADLNRKDGDPAAPEPQETERKPQTTPLLSNSPPAVRLFVTSSESCAPCVRLWKAVKNGEFSGFDVRHSTNFEGLRSYPAIRFQDSQGQWKVIYGYDDTTVETLRRLTSTNQFVSQPRITNPVVSQTDLVSMHNQLHGGGQWTWPGDLATHLQTVHGVNLNGIPANHGTSQFASQRSAVRLVSRGSPRGWRSSYQARSSCPAGGCPR